MEWKPIESAPKDDTSILLHFADIELMNFSCVGFYDVQKRIWKMSFTGIGNDLALTNPSHWMPLPNPPTP